MSDDYPYKFNPLPSITAYDLALIFKLANWLNADEKLWKELPDELRAYYKEEIK